MSADPRRPVGRHDPDELHESHFRALGIPVPQSGTRIVPTGAGPRGITVGGVGLAGWRDTVTAEAAAQYIGGRRHRGPVAVTLGFRFPMPASRLRRIQQHGSQPMAVRPDLDKLSRTMLDSLTAGGLIADDALVAELHAYKFEHFDSWSGCDVTVTDLWTP